MKRAAAKAVTVSRGATIFTAVARESARARALVRALGKEDFVQLTRATFVLACVAACVRAFVGGDGASAFAGVVAAEALVRVTSVGASKNVVFDAIDRYFERLSANLRAVALKLNDREVEKALVARAAAFAESNEARNRARVFVLALLIAAVLRVIYRIFGAMFGSKSRDERSKVRVVLITGGGGGLGKLLTAGCRKAFPNAIVYGTSRNGWKPPQFERQRSGIFGLGSPSMKQREEQQVGSSEPLGAKFDSSGGVVEHPLLAMDLTDENSIKACIAAIVKRHGAIDVVINNAGICLASWAKQTPREDADKIMQTNFVGVVSVVREALPHLSKGASIINIGSIAGRIGIPFQSLYSASKAALMVYTDALRMELKSSGVRVSLIEPGDLKPGMASVFKSEGFETDPVAVRAEQIMRAEEAAGTHPQKVVKAVVKAMNARKPKSRYLVGPDSWLVEVLSRVCSYRAKEYFLASHYRVPPGDKAWIRV